MRLFGIIVILAGVICVLGMSPVRAESEITRAEVRALRESPAAGGNDSPPRPWTELQVTLLILDGDRAGNEFTLPHNLYGHRVYDYLPVVGDRVIVALNNTAETVTGSILLRAYAEKIAWFLSALIILFLVMSRRAGLKSLLAILFSIVLLYGMMFHLFRAGFAVYPVGISIIFLATGIVGFLTFPRNTAVAATLGVWAGLAAVLFSNLLFFRLADISGVRTDPGSALHSLANNNLSCLTDADLTALLLLGSLVAVSGIIIDLGAVISSVLDEIRRNDPARDRHALRRIGIDLGKEIFPPLFNTLLLAYAGLALPFFGICYYLQLPWLKVVNFQFIAFEIVSLIASGLGMMAAIYAIPFALTAAPSGNRLPAKPLMVLLLIVLATSSLRLQGGAFELPEESELKVHPLLETAPGQADYFPARIKAVERDPAAGANGYEDVVIEGLAGDYGGRTFTAANYRTGNEHRDIRCAPGDYILARLSKSTPPGAPALVTVDDYLRLVPLGFIVLVFILLYVLFCRRRAVAGLLALALIVFTCFYLLPYGLVNFPDVNPLGLLLPSLSLLVVLLFLLQYGLTRKNLIALAAALTALLFSLGLGWFFLKIAHLQGFSSEYIRLMAYLNLTRTPPDMFSYQFFTVAGMVIYSLGVVIDATVDAVSGLAKVQQALPGKRPAFAPLRTIAVAMVGTLIFVSLGMNLMDFFVDSSLNQDQTLLWYNGEWLNLEAGRVICGCMVFLVTLLVSYLYFIVLTRTSSPLTGDK